MSTLGELQSLFVQVRQEEQNYWKDLRITVGDVIRRLAEVLGLDEDSPELLKLGIINSEGKFVRASIEQLPKNDRVLEFALQLVLSPQSTLIPPNIMETRWTIRETKDGIELVHKDERFTRFEDPSDAAQHITKVFQKKISSFSPYID